MQVRIDTERLDSLVRYLSGMRDRIDDFSIPMTTAGQWMREEIVNRILTAGGSDGRPFAPMAQSTIDRWGAHPLLQLSGNFARSPVYGTEKFAAFVTLGPLANLLEWGTRAPVSVSTSGGKINTRRRGERSTGEMKDPERPVAWLSQGTTERIMQLILDYATMSEAA